MTYLTNRVKTQRNLRNDGRQTITVKLIGWTEAELEDLALYLIGTGHADEERQTPGADIAATLGAYIRRAVHEPKQ